MVRHATHTLTEDTCLTNWREWDDTYGRPYITVTAGKEVKVRIEPMEDGRVYYTAYQVVGGVLYSYTKMFNPERCRIEPNVASAACHDSILRNE